MKFLSICRFFSAFFQLRIAQPAVLVTQKLMSLQIRLFPTLKSTSHRSRKRNLTEDQSGNIIPFKDKRFIFFKIFLFYKELKWQTKLAFAFGKYSNNYKAESVAMDKAVKERLKEAVNIKLSIVILTHAFSVLKL